jgi:hypothetical protein
MADISWKGAPLASTSSYPQDSTTRFRRKVRPFLLVKERLKNQIRPDCLLHRVNDKETVICYLKSDKHTNVKDHN